jgi:ribosome-associated protein
METLEIVEFVKKCLDDKKAEHISIIDLTGKGAIVDYMVVASGTSNRHVNALGDFVAGELKQRGIRADIEGVPVCDWVLLDVGDVLVHLFRPDVREFYNLEKMWGAKAPRSTNEELAGIATKTISDAQANKKDAE